MRSSASRRPVALVLAACTLMATAVFGASTAQAQSAPCDNRVSPPPAVDTSEQVAPGTKAPPPLDVPENPVGGERMGECGIVLPANAQRPPDSITAKSWLLADLDSGAVLAGFDPHGRQRPASVMKVLLAMVVAKELSPDATVAAGADDIAQECTCIGLRNGAQYTVEQLLQALVMASGNDVAHALARRLGGLPSAIRKMNALAMELGALDTRAVTPSGLDAPGTSTSAYDVALIFRAAMKYPDFAKAVVTQRIDFPAPNGVGTVPVLNDNKLLTTYEGALGGRSGFTDDAQHTYVGAAERNGRKLVVVLLRGQQTPTKMTDQAAQLLDYGFDLPAGEPVGRLVDGAPQTKKKTQEPKPSPTSANVDQVAESRNTSNTAMFKAFGNVGGPITAVAGLGLVLGFVLYLRNKKAKAARAARAAAQTRQSG
ncbi:serine hydrolase [Actinosynnema sp. NPDC047251]|uniref:Serine-type D-Ala-D-Ala carboxypeptidase n=1 Tax=Saccharothrix espanaensis (strain ATCC 51144 / DSM 44229 / JCM 9112 / NBRC 15066 / NRRL 15764) TaxID=1179773 RepID=K0KBP5_SACES|nr:serine hydrolase [Saccharothrix espanaensis]CCH34972.1 Serine-type D-Ala-D-Ala carboxypeptidase [Saccharothrix espanaensis DSM 44229]